MAGVFYISGLNGFRWTLETFNPDANLNSLPVDYEIDLQSYAAPIQKTDTSFPALVLLSDFPAMTLQFLTCKNVPIVSPVLGATSSSIVNQTFLQYLATVDFSAFPIGRCYGRISYDANLPAQIGGKLTELLSPFIDGNLQAKINGVTQYTLNSVGTNNAVANAGDTYSFEAFNQFASTAMNPRIRLMVTRTVGNVATVIYDKSEVVNGANSIVYSGTAQPGGTYSAVVITEDTAVVIAPINIPDNAPVVPNIQSWISCPIDVQQNHPDTQLMQYQNSQNAESVLFHPSNLILQTRIAANFTGGYQPKANRTDYEDQPYNPVLLNGFNYDIYTQYLTGYEIQLPDWRIKQLNLIWAKCDQVKIDYEFYVAAGDFKGERPTATYNRNGYNYELDLQIVKGFQFGQLTAGTTPTGDLIVVRKTWPAKPPFPNYTTSFAINGVFTQYSTIDYFQTINPALSTFILKIGTTIGGNEIYEGEIGTPNADASIELIETHQPLVGFNAATTVYVTLPVGVTIGFIVVYDQLDAAPVIPASSGGGIPQGTIAYYKELVAGYFVRDWDIGTGLGQVGSLYEGCQIYDEAAGKVLQAWDRNTVDPSKSRGTPGITGANQVGANSYPVITSANAAIGAVSIAVNALGIAIPANTKLILNTGAGQLVVVTTANAVVGAVTLSVIALTVAITGGSSYSAIGLAGGNEVTIARVNLPAEGLKVFADQINSTDSDFPSGTDTIALQNGESISRKNYSILKGTVEPTRGRTEFMGAGTALDITNDGLIMLCYIKL